MTTQGCHWTGSIEPGDIYTLRVPRSPAQVVQVQTSTGWLDLSAPAQEACTPKLRAALFDAVSERWRPRHLDVRVMFDMHPRAQCLDRGDELPGPISAGLARVLLVQVLEEKHVAPGESA